MKNNKSNHKKTNNNNNKHKNNVISNYKVSQNMTKLAKDVLEPISKEGMENFDNFKKQCWIAILSFLNFEELKTVALVCKTFFFILKENDRFWRQFVNKNFPEGQKLKECMTWKTFYFKNFKMMWNRARLDHFFLFDRKNPSFISTNKQSSFWKCCISKNHLMEGFLYPIQIEFEKFVYCAVGVCRKETELFERGIDVTDKHRYGYFCNDRDVCIVHDKNTYPQPGLEPFISRNRLLVMLHKGSYSQQKATVSFFTQGHSNKSLIQYQTSIKDIPLCDNKKLYLFFEVCRAKYKVQLQPPIPFQDRYFRGNKPTFVDVRHYEEENN